jgi:uncharacterized RDD family membrane protein YckC
VAGLIDYVGPFILANVVGGVVNAAVSTSTNLYFSPFGFLFSLLALGWALYNGYIAGQTGQSTGMKQSGLRLVGEQTGQPIGGTQGLVRNLLFLAYAICGCFGIVVLLDALWPLWDTNKQTLRDKIAKSVVVKG